ncbi:MAG: hypothetical protein ABJB97_06260 [Acidobacteriota bacterium]
MSSSLAIAFLLLSILGATGSKAFAQIAPNATQATSPSLSDAQKERIKAIKTASERKAAPLALHLAATVRRVYQNMLADKPDEKLRLTLSRDMHATAGALLTLKGQSIRETVNVLTPEQKRLIKSEMGKPGAPADLNELIEQTFHLADK